MRIAMWQRMAKNHWEMVEMNQWFGRNHGKIWGKWPGRKVIRVYAMWISILSHHEFDPNILNLYGSFVKSGTSSKTTKNPFKSIKSRAWRLENHALCAANHRLPSPGQQTITRKSLQHPLQARHQKWLRLSELRPPAILFFVQDDVDDDHQHHTWSCAFQHPCHSRTID